MVSVDEAGDGNCQWAIGTGGARIVMTEVLLFGRGVQQKDERLEKAKRLMKDEGYSGWKQIINRGECGRPGQPGFHVTAEVNQ